MTRDEINEMPAGYEMNVAIAYRVMRWPRKCDGGDIFQHPNDPSLAVIKSFKFEQTDFSGNEKAALEFVVPELRRRGWCVRMDLMAKGFSFETSAEQLAVPPIAACSLLWASLGTPKDFYIREQSRPVVYATSLALAICRAALIGFEIEMEALRSNEQ